MEKLDRRSTDAKTLQLLSEVKQQGQLVQEMKDTETRSVCELLSDMGQARVLVSILALNLKCFEVHLNIFVLKDLCLWSAYHVEQLFSVAGNSRIVDCKIRFFISPTYVVYLADI